jgi:hypothetical protein
MIAVLVQIEQFNTSNFATIGLLLVANITVLT